MKFRLRLRKGLILAIYLLLFLWLAIIALNVFRWCGILGLASVNLTGEIIGTVFALLFIVLLVRILTLSYVVDKNRITLGLFGIKLTRISVDAIWKILILEDSIIVCHTVNNTETTITTIFIGKNDFDDFGNAVRSFNPKVIVTDNTDDDSFPDDDSASE